MKLLLCALLIIYTAYCASQQSKEKITEHKEEIVIIIDDGKNQDINDFLDLTETYPNATITVHRKVQDNPDKVAD